MLTLPLLCELARAELVCPHVRYALRHLSPQAVNQALNQGIFRALLALAELFRNSLVCKSECSFKVQHWDQMLLWQIR